MLSELVQNELILYSTGCPKCKILEKKLNEIKVLFTTNNNVDEMLSLGLSSAPALSVDGKLMNFTEAMKWLRERENR